MYEFYYMFPRVMMCPGARVNSAVSLLVVSVPIFSFFPVFTDQMCATVFFGMITSMSLSVKLSTEKISF